MNIPFFLYRRLSRWISCELLLSNDRKIALKNKYEVASFKDVFCHPFYWQLFQWIDTKPNLVIDCGSHCGHFSILADLCIDAKFGSSNTHYILVEPNPYLIPILTKNLKDANLIDRSSIHQGLLGQKSGEAELWVNHKNYLQTGLHQSPQSKSYKIPYLNLSDLINHQTIDIMKIDIEGGEYAFIQENLDLFKLTNLVLMELHQNTEKLQGEALNLLKSVGLVMVADPVEANGQQLIILKKLVPL
jgi:FkbM family methyltransferase